MAAMARSASPLRAVHEADEDGLVADDEGGHAPHVVVLGGGLVLGLHGGDRGAAVDLGEHGVGVDALLLEHPAHLGLVAQVAAVVVAEREQRLVGVEEAVGELVAHDHARLQREQARVVRPAAPDVGLALGRRAPGRARTARRSRPTGLRRRSPASTCSWALRAKGQR